jgi:hypothetical protein
MRSSLNYSQRQLHILQFLVTTSPLTISLFDGRIISTNRPCSAVPHPRRDGNQSGPAGEVQLLVRSRTAVHLNYPARPRLAGSVEKWRDFYHLYTIKKTWC